MSYERIDINHNALEEKTKQSHQLRYFFALPFVQDNYTVLEVGAGTGYGKNILQDARHINYYGYDKNPVDGTGVEAMNLEQDECLNQAPDKIDVFIGIETIEHLDVRGVANFIDLAHRASRYAIISTPVVPNSNPYHKQQFTKQHIIDLMTVRGMFQLEHYSLQDEIYGIYVFKRL